MDCGELACEPQRLDVDPRLQTGHARSVLETAAFPSKRSRAEGLHGRATGLLLGFMGSTGPHRLDALAATPSYHQPAAIVTYVVGREVDLAINTLSRSYGPARRARVTASHTRGSESY